MLNILLAFPSGLLGVLKKIALVLSLNLLASSFGSSFQSALEINPSVLVLKYKYNTLRS